VEQLFREGCGSTSLFLCDIQICFFLNVVSKSCYKRISCYIPSADGCGCLHFFDEIFGGIKEMPYLCSVNGKSITLVLTLNY
jgi:hypothetical protein